MSKNKKINVKESAANRKNKISLVRAKERVNNKAVPAVDQILHLQRTIGNQAVQRLIKSGNLQTKLRIGKPGDKYEMEADKIADQVMRMPEMTECLDCNDKEEIQKAQPITTKITPLVSRQVETEEEEKEEIQTKSIVEEISPLVQKQEEEEEEEPIQAKLEPLPLQRQVEPEEEEPIQGKLESSLLQKQVELEEEEKIQTKSIVEEISPLVQRQEEEEEPLQGKLETSSLQKQVEEEEEPIQAKSNSSNTAEVSSSVESNISSLKGGGQPLSKSTREYFEPKFGYNFGDVRVHNDSKASEVAGSINAKAFTSGKDVVFRGEEYSPETDSGKRLLAHELTHVVQQNESSPANINSSRDNNTGSISTTAQESLLQRDDEYDTEVEEEYDTSIEEEYDTGEEEYDTGTGEAEETGADQASLEAKLQEEVDTWGAYKEAMESEEPLEAAYAQRVILLLQFSGPETFFDEYELEDYIRECTLIATNEEETLYRLPGSGETLLCLFTQAFPETWAERVFEALYVEVDLEDLKEDVESEKDDLMDVADRAPEELAEQGLPVEFREALSLNHFELKLSHIKLERPHIVKDFAKAGASYAKATWIYSFFLVWNNIIAKGMSEAIRKGELVLEYNSYVEFVENYKGKLGDLRNKVRETLDEGALTEIDNFVFVDLANAAVIGKFLSILLSLGPVIQHWKFAKALFNQKLSEADSLIEEGDFTDLCVKALEWMYENGYLGDYGELLWESIKENKWQIVGMTIGFIVAQYIPFVNVGVDVVVILYCGIDALSAFYDLVDAFVEAGYACSVVELQKASARLASALMGDGLRILLDLFGVTASVKGIKTRLGKIKSKNPGMSEEEALKRALKEAPESERVPFERVKSAGEFLKGQKYPELAEWALSVSKGSVRDAEIILEKVIADIASGKAAYKGLPSPPRGKVVAGVEGGTSRVSGWGKAGSAEDKVVGKVMETADKIGHKLRRSGGADHGVPGKSQASHAEKKISVLEPNKPIGVNGLTVCGDCQAYFQALAKYRGKTQIVVNSKQVWVFTADGRKFSLPKVP
jgi:hypothetical protein